MALAGMALAGSATQDALAASSGGGGGGAWKDDDGAGGRRSPMRRNAEADPRAVGGHGLGADDHEHGNADDGEGDGVDHDEDDDEDDPDEGDGDDDDDEDEDDEDDDEDHDGGGGGGGRGGGRVRAKKASGRKAGGGGVRSGSRPPGSARRAEAVRRRQEALSSWLNANFEPAENTSLPRNGLYDAYDDHCGRTASSPVNVASFGKIIRAVFPGIQTRRLGVRGMSRYYYHGIRVRHQSPLAGNAVLQTNRSDDTYRNRTGGAGVTADDIKPLTSPRRSSAGKASGGRRAPSGGASMPASMKLPTLASIVDTSAASHDVPSPGSAVPTAPIQLAPFGELPATACAPHDPARFISLYRDHAERLFRLAADSKFGDFPIVISNFWANLPNRITPLFDYEAVIVYVRDCDIIFYSSVLNMLVPDFLKSVPLESGHPVRAFAKQVENTTLQALQGMARPVARLQVAKFEVARAFALALNQVASLNHLARAARTVLKNTQQMELLLADWDTLDLRTVHDTVSRVCGCSAALMTELEGHVVQMLSKPTALEDWTTFLGDIYTHCVLSQPFTTAAQLSDVSHQFHLRWSFYCCTIVRDLTLRSANSFGSYHLMRLFFDDYMLFLADDRYIKHRLAELRGIRNEALMRSVHPSMVMAFASMGTLDAVATGVLAAPVAGSSPSPTTDAAIDLAQLAYSGAATQSPHKFRRHHDNTMALVTSPEYAPAPPGAGLQYNLSPQGAFFGGGGMTYGPTVSPARPGLHTVPAPNMNGGSIPLAYPSDFGSGLAPSSAAGSAGGDMPAAGLKAAKPATGKRESRPTGPAPAQGGAAGGAATGGRGAGGKRK